jgi:hypothetical protein
MVFVQADTLYNTTTGPAVNAGAFSTLPATAITTTAYGNLDSPTLSGQLQELEDEKVSKALPAFIGAPSETPIAKGSVSGTQAIDLSAGSVFTATCTASCTWNFTNVPSGAWSVTLILTNQGTGGGTATWQVGGASRTPKLNGGTALTWTAAGTDIAEIFSPDGGTTLYIGQSYKDAK